MSGVYVRGGSTVSNDQETILANSAVIDFQDPVYITGAGALSQIIAGVKVEGFYEEQRKTVTANNADQGGAAQKGQWDGNDLFNVDIQMSTLNSVAVGVASIGLYFDVNVTANVITMDTATLGATGQFQLIDVDPNRDGTTTLVRAKVAEPQQLDFT